ncbi:transcription factor GTE4-like [Malania oleifera]|uniref:transcription factor GTE4-like n=1 Tax=Malania oleifera TaxID=397392 RepID=UPI0025AE31E3|nr:transcription factor GTE4-like [Malania oleifera]XP_057952456.1 transcription factor GTE4-like [Malania oleifera]
MASRPLGSDDSREKHRWPESNKVYTRKLHNKVLKNTNNVNTSTAVTANTANNSKNSNINAAQQSSQTLATTEDGKSSQPQILSQFDAASDDSSSLDRPHAGPPNGYELPNGNGVMGLVKVDNRIKINNLLVRSKSEIRDIRRKLVGELDQVRSWVKKLEGREVQLSGYSGVGGYSHSQVSANDLIEKGGSGLRGNSEVGSVGPRNSRPFRELSVSVMENSHGVSESAEKEKRTPKANQYYRNSEFLLGKDKFPPPESNKKLKSKKHGGEGAHGFGMDKNMNQVFKSCNTLLAKLMKHKHGWVFNVPVDVKGLGLHDYYTIIKQPMDLGTVKSKLSKNWYKSPREFAEDVRLTFCNAMTYNPRGQNVHIMAEALLNMFEEKWAAIEAEYNLNWRYGVGREVSLPTPTSRKAPPHLPPQPRPETRTLDRLESMTMPVDSKLKPVSYASVGRTPVPKKPKAKDPHKRDMTYEEKQRLSMNLQSLPSEKLDNIVQIIKKRNSALSQHDDEIEVDIDSVDAETLWELDRFVTNYKKSLSKNKRKAELTLQARAKTSRTHETNLAPAMVELPKETKTDEKTVSTSPGQKEKQGDNASLSSSSTSSSSDSGSSSSDSDSGSSSAYGSDAGHSPGSQRS